MSSLVQDRDPRVDAYVEIIMRLRKVSGQKRGLSRRVPVNQMQRLVAEADALSLFADELESEINA